MTRKAKSRKEIALEFGISTRTLSRWFQKEKLTIAAGLISPRDQDLIYEKFGKSVRHPVLESWSPYGRKKLLTCCRISLGQADYMLKFTPWTRHQEPLYIILTISSAEGIGMNWFLGKNKLGLFRIGLGLFWFKTTGGLCCFSRSSILTARLKCSASGEAGQQ